MRFSFGTTMPPNAVVNRRNGGSSQNIYQDMLDTRSVAKAINGDEQKAVSTMASPVSLQSQTTLWVRSLHCYPLRSLYPLFSRPTGECPLLRHVALATSRWTWLTGCGGHHARCSGGALVDQFQLPRRRPGRSRLGPLRTGGNALSEGATRITAGSSGKLSRPQHRRGCVMLEDSSAMCGSERRW